MGKPFGNGFPLAAVCTTDSICHAFDAEGVEYFNTFGGGPAACAAGLAVLEILEEEKLQENAARVGAYLRQKLADLAPAKDFGIGDIRGSGLFIGVEWVRGQEPATIETSVLVSRLKDEYRILATIDGPFDNVLVIKPPMCFGIDEADILVNSIDQVLRTWNTEEAASFKHTPT